MKNRIKNTPAQVRRKHAGNVNKLQELKGKIDQHEAGIKSLENILVKNDTTLDKLYADLAKFKEENAEDMIPKTEEAIAIVVAQKAKDLGDLLSLDLVLNGLRYKLGSLKREIRIPIAKFKKCFAIKGINVPLM